MAENTTKVNPETAVDNDLTNEKKAKSTPEVPQTTAVLSPAHLLVQQLEQELAKARDKAKTEDYDNERKSTESEHNRVMAAIEKVNPRLTHAKEEVDKANAKLTSIQTEYDNLVASDPWLAIERKYNPPAPSATPKSTRRGGGGRHKSNKSNGAGANGATNGESKSEDRDGEFDVRYTLLTPEQAHDNSMRIGQTSHCVLGLVDGKSAMVRGCGELHRRHRTYNTLLAIKAALGETYNESINDNLELTDLTKLDSVAKSFIDKERAEWTAAQANKVAAGATS